MFTDEEEAFIAQATRSTQVIVAGFVAGVALISFLVLALILGGEIRPGEIPTPTYVALATALAAILTVMLSPGFVFRRQRQSILKGNPVFHASANNISTTIPAAAENVAPYMGGYQTAVVVHCLILAGAAFVAVFAYMLNGLWWNLGIAGVLVLFILAEFPTRSRANESIERERRTVEELRQVRAFDTR
jgi:hypothetical protein